MIANLPLSMKLGKNVSMALLKTQKHSPVILFGAGVVGVVGTVVTASRATLKLGDIVDNASTQLEKARTLEHADYSEQDRTKDKAIVYTKAAIDISKLYLPALAIGVISVGCLTGSHHILTRRNVALSAAYAGAEKALREYRERVVEEVGAEIEQRIWQPTEQVDAIDAEGKKVKIDVPVAKGGSPYKAVFDETNSNWNRDPSYNQLFIQSQQSYANDLLRAKGVVFLNDVHAMLGLDRTKAGQVVGWVLNGEGDNYIDFGVFRDGYDGMRFVMGEERSIWLDFNVDGNVLDILEG